MFGLKVGSKGLVLRLGFEVGSRDRSNQWILMLGPMDGSQGLGSKIGSQG